LCYTHFAKNQVNTGCSTTSGILALFSLKVYEFYRDMTRQLQPNMPDVPVFEKSAQLSLWWIADEPYPGDA
jgi:hypothetical protein